MAGKRTVSCSSSESEDANCLLEHYFKNFEFAKKCYTKCKRKMCNDCTTIYLPNIVEYTRKIGEVYFKLDSLISDSDSTNSDQGIKFITESLQWAKKWNIEINNEVGMLK